MSAPKIKSIEDVRNHAVWTLERLVQGDIDTTQAGVTGKLYEGIISTVKLQLEYSRLTGEEPQIDFLKTSNEPKRNLLEHSTAHNQPIKQIKQVR
jgi:hypothetical protein